MAVKMTNRVKIYNLANEMRGLITADMALEAGVALVEMRKLVQRGALERVARNLYRVPFAPIDDISVALEALFAVGREAYVSGESALALMDIGVFSPRRLEITTTIKPRRQIPNHVNLKIKRRSHASTTFLFQGVQCESVFDAIDSLIGREIDERLIEAINEAVARDLLTRNESNLLRRTIHRSIAKENT